MTDAPDELSPEQRLMWERLGDVFLPVASRKARERYPDREQPARFAHYTSADAALRIINTKRIWMRNTSCMTDYREVNHGYDLLVAAGSKLKAMNEALHAHVPNAATEAITAFDNNWSQIQSETFVTSVSEHEPSEDLHGRLSMWRAFGGTAPRVALVIRIPWLSGGAQALRVVFSPVAYMDGPAVARHIDEVTANIQKYAQFLKDCPRDAVVGTVFTMFLTGVTCLKHPGFHEEREWRAIHGPGPLSNPLLMTKSTKIVYGVPQPVYQIPLDVTAFPALKDLDFAVAFDRLIIGPSQYPGPMVSAFADALTGAGVQDARSKIFVSGIPIRT